MAENFEQKVAEALANPKNMGEMENADAVGTVGSPGCGDMLRMWIKFKEDSGKKVIDRATFQGFGCETAIAVASLATELIKGKTPEEAMKLSGAQLAEGLGALPPMKIHCGQLVEGALRSALDSNAAPQPATAPAPQANTLLDNLSEGARKSGVKITFLPQE
ncbi:MAG TPA: iron-sulfur cluster assembly scaffold protein [Methylomirabilota bacterium]|nr:iron-sulfur cluster assembly scaffold protein [Methylomirabilota bacterium]